MTMIVDTINLNNHLGMQTVIRNVIASRVITCYYVETIALNLIKVVAKQYQLEWQPSATLCNQWNGRNDTSTSANAKRIIAQRIALSHISWSGNNL